jgi:membrane protease YdiL (CAAX protease family)
LLEVLICSDYPTQLLIGWTLRAFGYAPHNASGDLALGYVVTLSLADTVALIALIVVFLRSHGERPFDVLIGRQPLGREVVAGARLAIVSFLLAVTVLIAIQLLAPALHTVAHNPLEDLIGGSTADMLLFGFVIVVAGGVREEIQRAFLLHRFERFLGGGAVGLVIVSIGFGSGHLIQGLDAAVVTGLLGAFWGVVYLRRRSAVASMTSHAGFNLLQLGQFLLGR